LELFRNICHENAWWRRRRRGGFTKIELVGASSRSQNTEGERTDK
jgi:hypothetical protein